MNTDLEPYRGGTPEPYERLTHDEMVKVGQALHQSGWFKDITDPGKAVVKIMLGQEMGVSPMTAVRGIFVIPSSRGPVITLSGDLVAKLMKAHGYTWTIDALDEQGCRLTIFSGPRKLGQVEFTQAMARKAGLLGKDGPWKQFTEDMFFNRAICRAQRRYAPEVTGGLPMPVVEAEELDASYPDPRDDLVKALHATYREVYPLREGETSDEYRGGRLDWSERILGRPINTWNGPEAPETLTRADAQTLLDALESTPALTREQAAPILGAASVAGADHTQGHTIVESPAWEPAPDLEGSAGEQPGPPKAPGRSTPQAPPAEHHIKPSGGQAATRVGTGSEAGDGKPQPSGGPSAPTRKRRPTDPTGAPGVKEAAKQATAPRPQTYQYIPPSSWFWTLPTHAGRPILEHFGNVMKAAEAWLKPIAEQESDKPLAEWGELDNWSDAKVNVILAALEAEKAGAQ